jgi:type II secretory pathway component PulF
VGAKLFWYCGFNKKTNHIVTMFCVSFSKDIAIELFSKEFDAIFITRYPVTGAVLYELNIALEELIMMLEGGISIVNAIEYIGSRFARISGIFFSISSTLSSGVSIERAFKAHIECIDKVLSTILSIGGDKAHWERSLRASVNYLGRKLEISRCLRSAISYPFFVMLVLTCSVWFQVIYIFPVTTGIGLYVLPLSLTAALLAMCAVLFCTNNIYLGSDYYRSCYFYSISSAMSSGLSMQHALSTVVDAFGGAELEKIELYVLRGDRFHEALDDFPDVVKSIIASGEICDEVGQACQKTSDFYLNKAMSYIDFISTLIGPIIITFIGVVLMIVVIYTREIYYDALM